ncbi:MAG: MBOAT family protein [Thermoleophilia bacterium]|nr:MBOAT family protein [Thermoleophilia bacterium]
MLFTSYRYALFVLLAFCAYYLVGRFARGARPQNVVLLALGYGFYALWDWRWCFLLAGITLSGFGGVLLLQRLETHRRLVLAGVLVINLIALGFFKYFGFFAESFASLLSKGGLYADWVTLNVVLPVGLSYYVFQNLSYVIDVYRRDVRHSAGLVAYATSLSFFPALLAGPITRPRDLLPQLDVRREFDDQRARDGLRQVLWGLFKKMVVADTIGRQVDHVWANIDGVDGLALAIVAVLYSVQIYCDFSGYADIAIGTGKILNLRLSKNFEYPYFATSIQAFWRRWHITLASWMRDYVYISMGGNRVGAVRHAFNVLVTFFLVGLWHGANWTFMIWGLLHGFYLVVENMFRRRSQAREDASTAPAGRGPSIISGVAVFVLVTIAWVFFRAPDLGTAVHLLGHGFADPLGAGDHLRYLAPLLLSVAVLVYEWFTRRWEHGLELTRLRQPLRWVAYLVVCLAVLLFGELGGQEGIYVQF